MKGKRVISVVLIISMSFGVLAAGCKNTTETVEDTKEEQTAWERYADEEITLDWYVNYSWFATSWGENLVLLHWDTGNHRYLKLFPEIWYMR